MVAGNGPASVKAYLGPLPTGDTGYTFITGVTPTRFSSFFGRAAAVWEEETKDVNPVVGQNGTVCIVVEVVDVN